MRLSHSSSEKDTSPQSDVSQQHIKLKQAWSWVHFGINPILLMVVVSLVVLMISRLGLTIWHWDQVPSNGLFKILLGAIRIDFASVCALYALPLLAVTIGSLLPKVRLGLWFVRVLQVYCAAAVSFLVMNPKSK